MGVCGGMKVCFVYSKNCSSLGWKQVFMMKSRWYISGKPLKNLVSGKVFSETRCSPWSEEVAAGTLVAPLFILQPSLTSRPMLPASSRHFRYVAVNIMHEFFLSRQDFHPFFSLLPCPQRSVGSYLWDLLSFLVVYFISHFSSSLIVLDANTSIETN